MKKRTLNTIWLDMDGVLCDYLASSFRVYRKHIKDFNTTHKDVVCEHLDDQLNIPDEATKKWVNAEGTDFWANLDKLSWTDELIALCREKANNVGILTNPGRFEHAIPGKLEWLKKHGIYHTKMPVIFAYDKWLVARPDTMLIDDLDSNCKAFTEHGGYAITPARSWNKSLTSEADIIKHIKSF